MNADYQLVGYLLGERYHVLERLGSGGMGTVFRAHDRELDELVALKVIHSQLASDPAILGRFRDEVKLARRVTHHNIARTFELGHSQGVTYCTMELVDGESLHERLVNGPPLQVSEAALIAREVCAGLAAAHAAGVIHRDIKPDNILLATDGRVVLADFGVAAITVSASGDPSGTPAYMAPEQALGAPPSPAGDVYALGVVLYEMLANRPAFRGKGLGVMIAKAEIEALHVPGVPPRLDEIVARATARDVEQRIATVEELGRLLEPWSSGGFVPAIETTRAPALRDVLVLAPRAAGDSVPMHLADGVYDALLRELAREPRARVLARVDGGASAAVVIELVAGEALAATIHCAGASRTVVVPLDVAAIELAAVAIASAVTADFDDKALAGAELAARDLVLQSRRVGRRGIPAAGEALDLAERARRLQPDDPQVVATHALAFIRNFVIFPSPPDLMPARSFIAHALAIAPQLAEAHVAAGHLELHVGDAGRAAVHYRTAIACSRHVADGHEGLGRMLLEAGFFAEAMARIDDAMAIAPNLGSLRWDVARAHALEGRWDLYDQLERELRAIGDRPIGRMRVALWRGDRATLAEVGHHFDAARAFEPDLVAMLIDIGLNGTWWQHRSALLEIAMRPRLPRRQAFVAQLVAEVASGSGDTAAGLQMIDHAADHGLFDLHWLERCPLLDGVRQMPAVESTRARIRQRAETILDALYGDADASSSQAETRS